MDESGRRAAVHSLRSVTDESALLDEVAPRLVEEDLRIQRRRSRFADEIGALGLE